MSFNNISQGGKPMHFADYKTILSPKNGMNIYRGCTHGCIYCDSRSKCYQMAHDFEDIEIKRNAPEILEEQLKRRRKQGMISTGAMTDPYIHLEEKIGYMRKCLEVIERQGFGVMILTKSDRVLRDLDLLKEINAKTKCVVQMTLTTFDEARCLILEPHVSTTAKRVKALKILRDEGIPTVVWLGPFLPFINDSEKNIQSILQYCLEAGVKGIICFGIGMTLREGNREYFYEKLDQHFPGLKEQYIRNFGNSYHIPSPNYQKKLKMVRDFCKKHDILYHDEAFAYMGKFESKYGQMTLF